MHDASTFLQNQFPAEYKDKFTIKHFSECHCDTDACNLRHTWPDRPKIEKIVDGIDFANQTDGASGFEQLAGSPPTMIFLATLGTVLLGLFK